MWRFSSLNDHPEHFRLSVQIHTQKKKKKNSYSNNQIGRRLGALGHVNMRGQQAEIKPTTFQLQDNYSTHVARIARKMPCIPSNHPEQLWQMLTITSEYCG